MPVAHPDLATSLDMKSYTRECKGDDFYLQTCLGSKASRAKGDDDRVAAGDKEALYLYIYPNICINRYGKWMDTNIIWPRGPDECEVLFDWYVEGDLANQTTLIENSIKESEQVQMEDIWLCERVQKGLKSSAYDVGRYSNFYEGGEYWFAHRLQRDLEKAISKENEGKFNT